MEMEFVDSTSIEAIGYDEEAQELHVRFLKTGSTYVYSQVPRAIYEEFMASDSKGNYLNTRVKGVFDFSQL